MMFLADFKAELGTAFAGSVMALSLGFWCSAATSLLYRPSQTWTLLEKFAVGILGSQFALAFMLFTLAIRSLPVREALGHGFLHIFTVEVFGFMTLVGLACSVLIRSDAGKKIAPATLLWLAGMATAWALPGK